MRIWAPLILAGALGLGACAGGAPSTTPAPAPQDLSALQAEFDKNPRDANLATRVGIGYYDARNYARARDALLAALAVDKANYPAQVYLGLTYEELGQFSDARKAYTDALEQARDGKRKSDLQGRLALLTQKELRAQARDAIAQEARLSNQPITGNAIAVMPFRFVGTNEELRPVSRGLTQLLITDLAKLSQLQLLEREQVQALVDEMSLTEAGRVDPATGARSGRLLRASRVIQGSVQDQAARSELKVDAAVVDAKDARVIATGTGQDKLQELFTVEKQILFRLVEQMGITLTPADRRALSERPTADLQAFLAYSRGLESEDRGDWAAAASNFSTAVARDPNFRAAKVKEAKAQSVASAQATTATQLAGTTGESGGGAGEGDRRGQIATGVLNTTPTIGGTLVTRIGITPVYRAPITRPALPETIGIDTPAPPNVGTIIIIITRP
ncbi:MAG TPA: CsgG/HfaB family protein [Gemmatimonadales bacterium]|nr:CsgG/HfaB family protein [Gemmatimonadales bacterium]